MKNIKIKSVIYLALICIFCTKLHAQNQWNLNAYHDYSTYIDLNCSLNGESNGTEAFLFYADNRSESKISFTVNYTITDNCGKSHSGSWSTSIIQARQRESIFKSVYTGCPIQKGKGHLVKNITCTVSNFKDLSKIESNSNANKITEQQNKTYTSTSTPSVNPTSNSNSSNNSQANKSTTTGSTYLQRQAAIEADQLKKYNELRERIAESQKQNQELSNQLVQGTTELAGMLSNIFAQNRRDREKREAKKDAERLAVAQEAQAKKQEWDDLFSWSAQRHLEAFAAGEESAAVELGYDKLILDKPDEAEKWYGQAAERGDVRGMMGMSDVTLYRLDKLTKNGVKRNDKKQIEEMKSLMLHWQEQAVMAGSIEACSTLVAYYRADPKMTSFALLKGDERIISILKRGEGVGYMTPFRHLGILFAQDGSRLYEEYIAKKKMADTTGAARILHLAADNYSPEALVEILKIYAAGHVQNSDTVKVMQILSKAAMLGNIEAIDNLVYCYSTGFGVKINAEKVAYWGNQKALYMQYGTDLFTAAHNLHSKGQTEYLLSNTNYKKSMEYYLEAAALGNAKAMEGISYYYKMPGMTEDGPDIQKSAAWKEKAKLAQREKPYDIE
jgi:TPR repeat protein